MKKKSNQDIYLTTEQRLSCLLVFALGIWLCYLLPSMIEDQIIYNLSYPNIISFDRLSIFIIGGAATFLMLATCTPYIILKGVMPYNPGKRIIIGSCYISIAGIIIAIIFQYTFITSLTTKGYGHCFPTDLHGPTLYVKDANECVKRNLPIMVRPRDQPKEDTPATVYEDPFHKWN